MDIIKEDGFRKLLKSGLSGGYLFYGDEDYLKAYSLKSARESVCEDETFAVFNDMRIDGLDYTAAALLDALMPLPMMSEKKIVTVTGLSISSLKPSEIDDMCDALEALDEYDYNVLIISAPAGEFDEGNPPKKPSAALTKLSKYLTPVRFDAVTPARLVAWLGKHFAHNGVDATPEVCSFMIKYCGSSMFTLSSETDKLSFYALSQGRKSVGIDDVKEVCRAEISADTYALANSILDGRADVALDALSVMKFKRVEPVIILSEVTKVITDLVAVKAMLDDGCAPFEIAALLFNKSEYRAKIYISGASNKSDEKLRRALTLAKEADLAMKSFNGGGYAVIERLICTL